MGGTFDPIHLGHLAVAEEVRERFAADRVLFLPTGQPPHKPPGTLTAAEDRTQMVLLATLSHPQFEVSRLEVDRPGLSFTVDTLRLLRQQLPAGCEVLLITGADAVLEIMSWREPEEVARLARILAVYRPGYDLTRLEAAVGPALAARIEPVASRGLDISSTEIRQRVAEGRSIRYLTPDPVVDYITRRGLYH
jgi:nicotinate-nucleotide adenylyltransferase